MATKKIDLGRYLNSTSLLNMFSPLQSDDSTKFLNVFKTSSVNKDIYYNEFMFEYYTITYDDWLDNISNKFYDTPYLWWVVAMFNDMTNPFEDLVEGSTIKILRYQYVGIILDDVMKIGLV